MTDLAGIGRMRKAAGSRLGVADNADRLARDDSYPMPGERFTGLDVCELHLVKKRLTVELTTTVVKCTDWE